jgi:thiopeptide-type bacteriocin biosynthesis protein
MFPAPDSLTVTGPEGRFVQELIVPFLRTTPGAPRNRVPPRAPAPAEAGRTARTFAPGSEWLFAKIYCGQPIAEDVLGDVVRPVVERARASGTIDRWFFIRYGDPEWHIRLRFHGTPERLCGEVLPALHDACAPLFGDGRIWKLDLGTYEREVERYGGPRAIEIVERLFEADSDSALALAGVDEDLRWRLALVSIHRFLGDLELDLDARRAITSRMRAAYAREHGAGARLQKRLGELYRRERAALESLLFAPQTPVRGARATEEAHVRLDELRAFDERSAKNRPLALALSDALGGDREVLGDVTTSLIHMIANRLLCADARAQELVLYDLLDRLYDSHAARLKPEKT